ncbi:MAG: hypothetical protein WAM78_20040 [Candidatus Sulfotelmatobacter sp.]
MAANKKAKKKIPAKKVRPGSKTPKKSAKKKASPKKKTVKRAAKPAARISNARRNASRKKISAKERIFDSSIPTPRNAQGLSGDSDSQGLSEVESADSESVGELLDEGNTFEAEAVKGVEQADDDDEREVRTREFPEDDVPQEYLDED